MPKDVCTTFLLSRKIAAELDSFGCKIFVPVNANGAIDFSISLPHSYCLRAFTVLNAAKTEVNQRHDLD